VQYPGRVKFSSTKWQKPEIINVLVINNMREWNDKLIKVEG
jgi:hypothetical protein